MTATRTIAVGRPGPPRDRGRRRLDAADQVVGLFPRDGSRLTVRLLQRPYGGILDGIERLGYDVLRARPHVSRPRKLVILGRARGRAPASLHPVLGPVRIAPVPEAAS
jgi:hypothetical protein